LTLDLARLKDAVSVERVLASRGVALRSQGRRLVGACPLHEGRGERSFVVDPERNLWFCFSACGRGGDVVDLVGLLHGVGVRRALEILAELAGEGPLPPPRPRALPLESASFRPFVRALSLDPRAPLLAAKGIRPETARQFEAGAWRGPGFLEGCVGVRLHDPGGAPLGYAGRRLDPEQARRWGKWKVPTGLPRSRLLYGAHRVREALDGGVVVVVECPWGVMRLGQIGVPAVALLGVHASAVQLGLLAGASRVVVLLDGDKAGREGGRRIRAALGDRALVIDLPDGLDPDDLDDAGLREMVGESFSS
jgi:DNA primase